MKLKNILLLSAALFAGFAATASADVTITGGGSSFDLPAFTKWFEAYKQVDGSVSFNYQPNGSGFGQTSLLQQTIDFGASDFTMTDETISTSKNGPILQIPIVAGAVVVCYNIPDSPKLKLDGDTIAGIFLGKITKWNDAKIAALNAGVTLPDLDIVTVHRADKSGTSFIFTDYLSAVSPDFKTAVGANAQPNWTGGLAGKGNAGVAGQIKQLPGAIGYVELAYAVQNKMAYATVKNQAGKFVEATPDSVSAALATAKIPDDFRFSLVNAPGDTSYPIAGASWVLAYQHTADAAKGKAIVSFLKWIVTDGQKISPTLEYAPLPDALQKRIVDKIASMN